MIWWKGCLIRDFEHFNSVRFEKRNIEQMLQQTDFSLKKYINTMAEIIFCPCSPTDGSQLFSDFQRLSQCVIAVKEWL
jgi:hypothetical protein